MGLLKLQFNGKYFKNEGGPYEDFKKIRRVHFGYFLASILLQNIETNEGHSLVQSKNFEKKSHNPEKSKWETPRYPKVLDVDFVFFSF